MTPGLAPKAAIPYKATSGAWLDSGQCQCQRGPLGQKLQIAATLRIKKMHSTGQSAIQNKVSQSDQRFGTQSPAPPLPPGNGTDKIQALLLASGTGQEVKLPGWGQCGREKESKKKARVHHSQGARLRQPQKVQIWIFKRAWDKEGRGKVEKGFRDSSATEPRKVGNDTKPKKTQQIRKRQVCQAGWQEH